MEKPMTKEESYVERRKLFKDIWETALHMDAKDGDIMTKPKVIKTLRLDEIDRINIGKTKKQRIRNLRNVCNRLLDFCDRQDADDHFNKQFVSEAGERPKLKLKKKVVRSKKMKKAKSYPPSGDTKPAISGGRDVYAPGATETTYPSMVHRFKRTTVVKKPIKKNLNPKPSPLQVGTTKAISGDTASRRKVVKIKQNKNNLKRLPKPPQAGKISVN